MSPLHQRCINAREIASGYFRKSCLQPGAGSSAADSGGETTVLVATLAASLATLIVDFAERPTPMIGILFRMIQNGIDQKMPRPLWDALVAIAEMDPAAPDWIRRDILYLN